MFSVVIIIEYSVLYFLSLHICVGIYIYNIYKFIYLDVYIFYIYIYILYIFIYDTCILYMYIIYMLYI